MSPEMIRHELYNSRTDVYSWGVMFVELLTQQRPYERLYMTPVQVSLKASQAKPVHVPWQRRCQQSQACSLSARRSCLLVSAALPSAQPSDWHALADPPGAWQQIHSRFTAARTRPRRMSAV